MRKLLVANRGEIACRVIRSARALGIASVAVYSDADATALHVAQADEAVRIGPPKAAESYLRMDAILDAARKVGADAVHPGYGFLAENADFARAVARAGLVWVGPAPESIEDMGDKERGLELARAAGVPTLPGSGRFRPGELDGLAEAAAHVGYPLLVKPAAGGGGIGMKLVRKPEDLIGTAASTQTIAEKAFGDGTVYLERYVSPARHVEIQVFGFGDGRAVHLYERECSIQRRFQKVVEESPSPGLSPETRLEMAASAVALARQVRYAGAGTLEFVVGTDQSFYFLEMNTRIQVEHPVTEMVTGLDLVAMQLRLARGEDLAAELRQDRVKPAGHAIECRLYAERPEMNFLPSPGRITMLRFLDEVDGIRIDCGVREGDQMTFHYDPLIAKLIVHASHRRTALAKAAEALDRCRVEGIHTNVAFLSKLVRHPRFVAGDTFTDFAELHLAELK